MEIHTRRCHIRPFSQADLDAFVAYRNNPEWMRWQSFKGLKREAYAQVLLGRSDPKQGIQLAIAHAATNALLGDIFLLQNDDVFWIGYTVAPHCARQGYAREAVEGLVRHLGGLGCRQICAGVMPQNTVSVHLLESLGFSRSGTARAGEWVYTLAPKDLRP